MYSTWSEVEADLQKYYKNNDMIPWVHQGLHVLRHDATSVTMTSTGRESRKCLWKSKTAE